MKHRVLTALLAACFLTGCATFNETELAIIQRSGISPRVFEKMQAGRVLTPEDVIELHRRRVPDRYVVRQIDDVGVDYVLSPEDDQRLQRAGVSPQVIEMLIAESDDFASRYAAPRYDAYFADPYYYDEYYYGPRPLLRPRIGGAAGVRLYRGPYTPWRHP